MIARPRNYRVEDSPWVADDLLWNKFRSGDTAAFEIIFKRYHALLTQYGVRFFHDSDLVEDCIQELFLHLWNRRDRLGEVKAVKYYLITSLRRLLLRSVLQVRRQSDINTEMGREQDADVSSHENQLINQLSSNETSDHLALVIQKLPPRQKEALYLKFYEDRSYEEITSIMSVNYQTARKFIYKALQVLRKSLVSEHKFEK